MKRFSTLNANTVTGLVVSYGYLSVFTAIPRFILYGLIGIISLLSVRYVVYAITSSRKKGTFFLLLVAAFIITYISAAPHFMFALYLAAAYFAEQKNLRSMVKSYFIVSIILFTLTILLNSTGILPSNTAYRSIELGNTIMRSSLGFTNPNGPMLYALPIVASAYYLYGARLLFYLLAIPFVTIIYKLTDSRTGLACMAILFISSALLSNWKKISQIQKFILQISFTTFTALSIWLAATIGSNPDSALNILLSNRLGFWHYYVENRSLFSLVGGGIESGQTLDNVYLYILYGLNGLVFIIYALVYYKGIKAINPNETKLGILIIVYLLYGMFETNTIMTSVNFSLPLILYMLIATIKVRPVPKSRVLTGT